MRATIAVLFIVVSAGNAAYLGIPPISSVNFAPVRTADWQWYHNSTTGDKLAASGAVLLWSSTITSLAGLPWLKESQRRKWYVPIACAYLGGAALYMAGKLVERH
jgi:apolipoprotein N-acyltransferase